MTATYQIPTAHAFDVTFRSTPVDPKKIHAIVPTYNDWEGLLVTLNSLQRINPSPPNITIVNDNISSTVPEWLTMSLKDPRLNLINCDGNCGPAYARNLGFGFPATYTSRGLMTPICSASQNDPKVRRQHRDDPRLKPDHPLKPTEFTWHHDIHWFYFTDCGCEHDPNLFVEFEEEWQNVGDSCVAISGPVNGAADGRINAFMTKQAILSPPKEKIIYDRLLPQAIVTANALISGVALSYVGGFDETFNEAAGEDLDLGLRLRPLGVIGWAERAIVRHRFREDQSDFYNRFKRYGRGNRHLELKHNLPSLRARRFKAELPEFQELADLSVKAMQEGYDEAVDPHNRGKITITNPDS